ncbi:Uu.00g134300.m01.CDS01 [Anthostomella pinea]|uniref:Uu.00g134300.m01.CDS01 n=1 Tax=Anthostomella pinea TaxID=933095 RepID=A0AAI8VNZ8_9PEZI|nr:Uu.00g134300.m01.CDS01 [Anthostomella pinea]
MPTYTIPSADGLSPGSGPIGFGTPIYEGLDNGLQQGFNTIPTLMPEYQWYASRATRPNNIELWTVQDGQVTLPLGECFCIFAMGSDEQ